MNAGTTQTAVWSPPPLPPAPRLNAVTSSEVSVASCSSEIRASLKELKQRFKETNAAVQIAWHKLQPKDNYFREVCFQLLLNLTGRIKAKEPVQDVLRVLQEIDHNVETATYFHEREIEKVGGYPFTLKEALGHGLFNLFI